MARQTRATRMEFGLWQVWEAGWVTVILRGAAITILVGFVSMAAGLVIGIVCGLIKWARIFPLSLVVDAYT
ncbi:MAG: ABC transporter permease, partial [Mesorhizobium sp.]